MIKNPQNCKLRECSKHAHLQRSITSAPRGTFRFLVAISSEVCHHWQLDLSSRTAMLE